MRASSEARYLADINPGCSHEIEVLAPLNRGVRRFAEDPEGSPPPTLHLVEIDAAAKLLERQLAEESERTTDADTLERAKKEAVLLELRRCFKEILQR